jgi:thioesterase domain-containing protein/acyl carrier protein
MAKHPSSRINDLPAPATHKPKIAKVDAAQAAGIAREMDPSDVRRRIIGIWERALAPRAVDPTKNFFELGGDSQLAVRLFSQMGDEFQCKMPPLAFRGAPTIDQLVQIILDRSSLPFSPLVPVQPLGTRSPLYFVHGSGGEPTGSLELSRCLGSDQPVYGLRSLGLCGGPVQHSVPEIAEHYVKCIRRIQPKGPYCLSGFCFGGLVAYEMARILTSHNEKVPVLALFDAPSPGSVRTLRTLDRVRKRIRHDFWRLRRGQLPSILPLLGNKARGAIRIASRNLKGTLLGTAEKSHDGNARELEQEMLEVSKANIAATKAYLPSVYAGPTALFLTPEAFAIYGDDLYERWTAFCTGRIELHSSDGEHKRQFEDPFVRTLAKKLEAILLHGIAPSRPIQSARSPAMAALRAVAPNLSLPGSPLSAAGR